MKRSLIFSVFLLLPLSMDVFAQNPGSQDDLPSIQTTMKKADKQWDALVAKGPVNSADDILYADSAEHEDQPPAPRPAPKENNGQLVVRVWI